MNPYIQNPSGYVYNQTPYTSPKSQNDLLQVNGLEGARNYPVSPNCRVVLFDSNQDIFYIKSTDSGGYPSISTFQFSAVQEQNTQLQNFATKDDLGAVLAQIQELREELKNGKLTFSQQPTTTPKE